MSANCDLSRLEEVVRGEGADEAAAYDLGDGSVFVIYTRADGPGKIAKAAYDFVRSKKWEKKVVFFHQSHRRALPPGKRHISATTYGGYEASLERKKPIAGKIALSDEMRECCSYS